jgi:DNA-binding YbaB/EbfC family protein
MRKLQVFISSTFEDLKSHRQAIIHDILKAGHIPTGMEFFTSGQKLNQDFLSRQIHGSDIFVLLVAARRGAEIKAGKSYTDFEFEEARKANKEIIAFVQESPTHTELSPDVLAFRDKVKTASLIVEEFSNEGQLSVKFTTAFHSRVAAMLEDPEYRRAGWVRATDFDDQAQDLSALKRFRGIPKEFSECDLTYKMVEWLASFEKVVPRLAKDVPEKRYMAELVWRLLAVHLFFDRRVSNIFFEGGTSILHLAQEYDRYVNDRTNALRVHATPPRVYTNHILCFLNLAMPQAPFYSEVNLFPPPPLSGRYGNCFGEITTVPLQNADEPLSPASAGIATKVTENVVEALKSRLGGRYGVAFTSCTGYVPSPTKHGFGPWTRSHYNMLFKRSLVLSGSPVVFLLDGRKWDRPFDREHPFPLFHEKEWAHILNEGNVAFAMTTFLENKRDAMIASFQQHGFRFRQDVRQLEGREASFILATGRQFEEWLQHGSCSPPSQAEETAMRDMMGMMKQVQALQTRMKEVQDELAAAEIEGRSGGGLVSVTLDGKGHIKKVRIDPSLMKPDETEIVEDLILAAADDASAKVAAVAEEKMREVTGGLPLPPGMKLF